MAGGGFLWKGWPFYSLPAGRRRYSLIAATWPVSRRRRAFADHFYEHPGVFSRPGAHPCFSWRGVRPDARAGPPCMSPQIARRVCPPLAVNARAVTHVIVPTEGER